MELTIEPDRRGEGYNVYKWGEYPPSSVLAGQTSKQFVDALDDLDEARAKYPTAEVHDHRIDACNGVSHLPGPNDPVAGGMYPDDIDDGY